LDSPKSFVRVAYNQSKNIIIGVAVSSIISEYPWSKKYGVIADIVVDSNFRRMGVGKKLVEDAENLLKTNFVKDIFIEINNDNTISKSFFSKLSYRIISVTACKRID
jgi:ribosomal protein S18 acetylase RimI-like enzyme